MPDPFKVQGRALNPLPEDSQSKPVPLHQSGMAVLEQGYSVLDRADRLDMFQPTIPRGDPVTNDKPTVAWDEEK